MFKRNSGMLFTLPAILILGVSGAPANAQSVKGLNEPGGAAQTSPALGEEPSQFLIEPEAQIEGDKIKRQTYRSQPAGQNKKWDLDIGRFQPPINDDPNGLAEDLSDNNYSGVRLRLPFRGRAGQ